MNLQKEIRVVPGSFWMILCGSGIIVAAVVIWLLTGWTYSVLTIEGVYHPGASEYGEVICFPNVMTGKYISKGMYCIAGMTYYDQSEYGHMTGTVTWTEDYITSEEEVITMLGDSSLADAFWKYSPLVCVICSLDKDPTTANGFAWSNSKGGDLELKDGTFLQIQVILMQERPTLKDLL